MKANSATGYVLLAIGVVLLAFTFYQAYTIFTQIMQGTFALFASGPQASSAVATGQNASIQNIVGNAVSSALAGLHLDAYATALILLAVLALFASIGYKFAKIGVELIKSAPQSQQPDSSAKKQKG